MYKSLVALLCMSSSWLYAQNMEVLRLVPSNATMAMHYNSKMLYSKIHSDSKKNYSADQFASLALNEQTGNSLDYYTKQELNVDSLFEAHQYMGIDPNKEVYNFVLGNLEKEHNIITFYPLKNAKHAAAYIENIWTKDVQKASAGKDYTAYYYKNYAALFNKKQLIFIESKAEYRMSESWDEYKMRQKTLPAFVVKNLFEIYEHKHSSMAVNKAYLTNYQKSADANLWINTEKLFDNNFTNLPPTEGEMAKEFNALLKNQVSLNAYVQQGLFKVDMFSKMSEGMSSIIHAANTSKFNEKFLAYIAKDNTLAYYNARMNLPAVVNRYYDELAKILNKNKMGRLVIDAVDIYGIFIDEQAIYDLFDGSMYFGLNSLKLEERSITRERYNPETGEYEPKTEVKKELMPQFMFMMGYKNEINMQKFVKLGLHTEVLKEEQAGLYSFNQAPFNDMKLHLILHQGVLLLTNDELLIRNHKGLAQNRRLEGGQLEQIKKYPVQFYMDMATTYQLVEKLDKQSDEIDYSQPLIGMAAFKNIHLYTEQDIKDNKLQGKLLVEMNQKENTILDPLMLYLLIAESNSKKTSATPPVIPPPPPPKMQSFPPAEEKKL